MLKNRHTISSIKVSKRPIRPVSSVNLQNKPNRISVQINNIISSLERNVKDLKTFYHNRQQTQVQSRSLTKRKNSIRFKKVLKRNGSQTNLRQPSKQHSHRDNLLSAEHEDKTIADVFQVKNYFLKLHGRQSNNIVQLYQFYKKNIEKRQKSTRILASIDLSNPNMGLSLDVGKQSIIRPEILKQPKLQIKEQDSKDYQIRIQRKFSDSSKWDNIPNVQKQTKYQEKPSNLAADLLSKGLYNITNVTNLMINKKYKLTKEKQKSFQMAMEKKQMLKKQKIVPSSQNNQNLNNKNEISINKSPEKINDVKCVLEKQKYILQQQKEVINSVNKLDYNYQFNDSKVSSIQKINKSKTINKEDMQLVKEFDASSIKMVHLQSQKYNQISRLSESPIAPNKGNNFLKSKYYVQPIPTPNKKIPQQKSISLQSNSRIINMDMLSFDL